MNQEKNFDDFESIDDAPSVNVYTPEDKFNRIIARGTEGAIGLPGDLLSLGVSGANWATKKLTGSEIPGAQTVQDYLPTSENVRKAGKYLFGNKFEPEKGEDGFWDKVASDFGSYIVPIGGAVKLGTAATRALAGNVASEGAKMAGFGETGQAIAKLTTNMLSMFPGSSRYFNNKSNQAYEAAKSAIPQGAVTKAKDLEKDLLGFEKEFILKGDSTTPAKKFLQERVNAVGNKISNDIVPVDEIWELKKDFNQLWKNGEVPQESRYAFGKLIDKLGNTLQDYGKVNPIFGENFNVAEDIFKGFRRMDDVSKFITKNTNLTNLIKKGIKSPTASSLLGGLTYATPASLATKSVIGGTAFGLGQVVKYGNFIKNSSEARKTYGDILKYSAAKDITNAAKSIKKFDKIAQHYDAKFSDFEPVDEFLDFESV